MGVVDRPAGEDEPAEQLAQGPAPGPLPRSARRPCSSSMAARRVLPCRADEPHGVAQVAVGPALEAVDGDDPGVLQEAGGLGLEEELVAVVRVVAVALLELLQGDLAAELLVARR